MILLLSALQIDWVLRLVIPKRHQPAIDHNPAFNLPDQRYIHMLAAVRGEDVLPDGTARLKWPAYSGEGLAGYVVYRPMFEPKSLDEMQQMTRDELVMMGPWEKAADKTDTESAGAGRA